MRWEAGEPGAVEPVRKGERLLFDGGIISMIPVKIAREETITSFFKTWIDLIKNLGVRRQYED